MNSQERYEGIREKMKRYRQKVREKQRYTHGISTWSDIFLIHLTIHYQNSHSISFIIIIIIMNDILIIIVLTLKLCMYLTVPVDTEVFALSLYQNLKEI